MKTLAFFTAFDGIMRGRKSQRKDICTLSALSGASGLYAEMFGEKSKHARAAVAVPQLLLSKASCRMAQYLTDILCGRATAAAMVTLAAAYLAVTLLVQEARFVKRFYVRRLTNNGAINFNGYTITLADGTVLR